MTKRMIHLDKIVILRRQSQPTSFFDQKSYNKTMTKRMIHLDKIVIFRR